jgi:hypothetical protein
MEGGAYSITMIEVFIRRASASLVAPSGPILFPLKLWKDDEKEVDRDRKRILNHNNRGIYKKSPCQIDASLRANIFVQ